MNNTSYNEKGCEWQEKLCQNPEKADKCPWDVLDGNNWAELLMKQPQFAGKCPWDKLAGEHWVKLLAKRSKFADQCDWSKLNGADWAELLFRREQFLKYCDFDKFNGSDWVCMLTQNIAWIKYCRTEKLDETDIATLAVFFQQPACLKLLKCQLMNKKNKAEQADGQIRTWFYQNNGTVRYFKGTFHDFGLFIVERSLANGGGGLSDEPIIITDEQSGIRISLNFQSPICSEDAWFHIYVNGIYEPQKKPYSDWVINALLTGLNELNDASEIKKHELLNNLCLLVHIEIPDSITAANAKKIITSLILDSLHRFANEKPKKIKDLLLCLDTSAVIQKLESMEELSPKLQELYEDLLQELNDSDEDEEQ